MALTPAKDGWRSVEAATDGASIGRSGRYAKVMRNKTTADEA